jgi:hypothetical protein
VEEHGLRSEEPADRDAVEAAGEPVCVPGLDRVCPAELMQAPVCGDEAVVDPAVRPGRVGAGGHHLAERRVDSDLEPPARTSE